MAGNYSDGCDMPRQPPTFNPSKPKAPRHVAREADRQKTRALHTGTKAWRLIREQVLVRDGYKCQSCGRVVTGRQAHVDHVDGNSHCNDMSNLATRCVWGHSRKTFAEHRGVKWDGKCEVSRGTGVDGYPL